MDVLTSHERRIQLVKWHASSPSSIDMKSRRKSLNSTLQLQATSSLRVNTQLSSRSLELENHHTSYFNDLVYLRLCRIVTFGLETPRRRSIIVFHLWMLSLSEELYCLQGNAILLCLCVLTSLAFGIELKLISDAWGHGYCYYGGFLFRPFIIFWLICILELGIFSGGAQRSGNFLDYDCVLGWFAIVDWGFLWI